MCKLLSDSILQGAVVAPAEVPSYRGLLALVQCRMKNYAGDLTSVVSPTLESLGYRSLQPSSLYAGITYEDANISNHIVIRIPVYGNNDSFIDLITTLLGYEKYYSKCYLSKVYRTRSKQVFDRILKKIVSGVLSRIQNIVTNYSPAKNETLEILVLHYVTMVMEISLIWNTELFSKLYPLLLPFFARPSNNNIERETILLEYNIIEFRNKVKSFIQEQESFSLQKVSAFNEELNSDTLKKYAEQAYNLYRELNELIQDVPNKSQDSHLNESLCVLENFLFHSYSGIPIPGKNWYNALCNSRDYENIKINKYSNSITIQRASRASSDIISSFLSEPCLKFLIEGRIKANSIPRQLINYLTNLQCKYDGNFSKDLSPLYKDPDDNLFYSGYTKISKEKCVACTKDMVILCKGTDKTRILSDSDVEKLISHFNTYCKTGTIININNSLKITILNRKKEALCGFFIKAFESANVRMDDCYYFLYSIFTNAVTGYESFRKTKDRKIQAFDKHIINNGIL